MTLAAWLYDIYRLLVKPRTRGALVALWCQARVLLVQASYRRELSLQGWINRNEAPEQAGRRELFEGLRMELPVARFVQPWVLCER